MMFTKATLLALAATFVSATPLSSSSNGNIVARNTDPSGSYPVCKGSSTPCGKPFYLACTPYGSDAPYGSGFLQQVHDGQLFCGNPGISPTDCEASTKPFFFFSADGYLYDNHGRKVEVAQGQLQANYGGGSTTFGICNTSNQLTVGGINTICVCKNDPAGNSYRVYSGSQVPGGNNANCNVVYLTANYL